MTSNREVVALQSQRIAPCMTCPICNKLFKNATTITECLHTFCRKCIYDKIRVEELDTCPVCDVYLGCAPLEKLRADHIVQDLEAAIFRFGGRRASKEPEVGSFYPLPSKIKSNENQFVPFAPFPTRRKERSLSSLVSPPKVSNESVTTGKVKSSGRKVPASGASALSIDEPSKKEQKGPESLSPLLTPCKITQKKRQNPSSGESSKPHMPPKGAENPAEPLEGKTDLWKPLNCLVEAAGMTKSVKPLEKGCAAKLAPSSVDHEDEVHFKKTKFKQRANKSEVSDAEGGSNPLPSGSVKPKKIHGSRQKRAAAPEGSNVALQAVVDAANTTCHKRVHPIWLSLIASDAQEGDAPLAQIPSCYLMIKNSNLPVSFIQKYLVQKLDLNSEAEVEITLLGQPVPPDLELHSLVNLWLTTTPSSTKIKKALGSSGKDFVMVLHYSRKAQAY